MSSLSFDEQIRRHIKSQTMRNSEQDVDWAERLKWWVDRVNELLSSMEQWLAPLIADGTIRVSHDRMQINEDMLGHYELPVLNLNFGESFLCIKPVGSVIIGAFGRIDVEGPTGRAMLILTTDEEADTPSIKREEARWFIVNPEQQQRLFTLDERVFKQLVLDLLGVGE